MGRDERLQLWEAYRPLVKRVWSRLRWREAIRVGREDAIQVGEIALWVATGGFADDGRAKFITYAYRCVFGAMMRAGGRAALVPVPQHRLFAGDRHRKGRPVLKPQPVGRLGYRVPDRRRDGQEVADAAMDCEVLLSGLGLDRRQREVLMMRHGLGLTYREIGASLGVSKQRAQQLLGEAEREMRERHLPPAPD